MIVKYYSKNMIVKYDSKNMIIKPLFKKHGDKNIQSESEELIVHR